MIPNKLIGGINPALYVAALLDSSTSSYLFPSSIRESHLTPNAVSLILVRRLAAIGLGEDWSSHSIRIGGAVFAGEQGKSELEIRGLGGWRSDAIFQYTRVIVRNF